MHVIPVTAVHRGFGATSRRDAWWAAPLVVFLGLSAFVAYATWAAFQNAHYTYGPYLSPFYSPELFGDSPHAWFGPRPAAWPGWLPFSPALLILPFPGLFRFTCYYYRGAYYKSFWADPPSCAVGEPRTGYRGENSWPLILQNANASPPRSYIYCTRLGPGDPFGQFARRFRSDPAWRFYEIDASHSPNVTAPEALVRLLEQIAR